MRPNYICIYSTLLALCLCPNAASAENLRPISQNEFGEQWPFTVSSGVLVCEIERRGGYIIKMVTFIPAEGAHASRPFAINGAAQTKYSKFDPFWRNDEKLIKTMEEAGVNFETDAWKPKINIGPMISEGLTLCE